MNNTSDLIPFLDLLIPDASHGALLPTSDVLTLFGLPSEYHVRKHRESGALQPDQDYIQVKGQLRPDGIQDNTVRIYYTLAGLLKLCQLNVSDRCQQLYHLLLQVQAPTSIIPAPTQSMQPWQAAPTQITHQPAPSAYPQTYAPQGYEQPAAPYSAAGAIASAGYGQPIHHPRPITGTPVNSPGYIQAAHPSQVIAQSVQEGVHAALHAYKSDNTPDANAHQVVRYLAEQQERDLKLFESAIVAGVFAGERTKTQPQPLLVQSSSEWPDWMKYLMIALLAVASAGMAYFAMRSALRPSTSYVPVEVRSV